MPRARLTARDESSSALSMQGFVAGEENRLLVAVLQAWCAVLEHDSARTRRETWSRLTSPLVLVGSTGCGKTHLAAGLADLAGDEQACFAVANDLRRDFADAIEANQARAWHDRLVAVPLLIIDDLDHLPIRGSFQQELLHLLQDREALGQKLIVTSSRPIAHLDQWLPDLANWFASGLTIEISPLGTQTRRELFEQLAATNLWQLTDSALDLLVEQTPPEPRELFRLAADMLRQFGPGARFEADTLAHFLNKRKESHAPSLRDIVRLVARYHEIPLKQLTSASRRAAVVSARATAIYLARTLTSSSYEQIGQILGGRDHTTIMHNFRKVEKSLPNEAALRAAIDDLTRLLRK
ncbi:DnaA/Hda family protein [Aeoliella mucimassa]|uniref:Chromosomal replication initiator protein DnaA n=1 Tax=Aeoliella mucimassa TaxID=2527972 RepID=A0A518AGG9_9BACT|nr:helix-turn-helix domain-containing protein [Aeoliella mucimassa]QDU53823.1 Chromosomal replication initiator protein DnaA [Aeoliella mucimassa]